MKESVSLAVFIRHAKSDKQRSTVIIIIIIIMFSLHTASQSLNAVIGTLYGP